MLWCNQGYHSELAPFCSYSSVRLGDIKDRPKDAIDSWIGQDQLHTKWKWQDDFSAFQIKFFDFLARRASVCNPLTRPEHLRLDGLPVVSRHRPYGPINVLLVNSTPLSYQWTEDLDPLHKLVNRLKGRIVTTEYPPPSLIECPVPCTRTEAPKLIDVGAVAIDAKFVIGIDTGPMIPTFNVYSHATHIVCHNAVNYDFPEHPRTVTVQDYAQLEVALNRFSLLK